jgi:hypothetical protein
VYGELIPITAIFFTIGVPVMALAAHFVLRPMVRDIITAIQASKATTSPEMEQRLAKLEDGYSQLETQVTRLLEAESFRRELEAGKTER